MNNEPSAEDALQESRNLIARASLETEDGKFSKAQDTLDEVDAMWIDFVPNRWTTNSEVREAMVENEKLRWETVVSPLPQGGYTMWTFKRDDLSKPLMVRRSLAIRDKNGNFITTGDQFMFGEMSVEEADNLRAHLCNIDCDPESSVPSA